nr:PREDICTED: uncharacterized protein LOC106706011 [Latimeria chalumnae]|eukprot:XP_014351811.1 PREDICTED: uncharacterized protein LOC106706011 [Latimeria chalumnae]
MRTVYDVYDTTAWGAVAAVSLRRRAWLRGTSFMLEDQQWILNLPFVGDHLFGDKAESTFQKLKDSKLTVKSLALLAPGLLKPPPKQVRRVLKHPFVPMEQLARPPPSQNDDVLSTTKGAQKGELLPPSLTPSRQFDSRTSAKTSPPRHLSTPYPEIPTGGGGRISYFLPAWEAITSDRWVLEIVQRGCAIQFREKPPSFSQNFLRPSRRV